MGLQSWILTALFILYAKATRSIVSLCGVHPPFSSAFPSRFDAVIQFQPKVKLHHIIQIIFWKNYGSPPAVECWLRSRMHLLCDIRKCMMRCGVTCVSGHKICYKWIRTGKRHSRQIQDRNVIIVQVLKWIDFSRGFIHFSNDPSSGKRQISLAHLTVLCKLI